MSEQPPTRVFEGIITESLTPAAFKAATDIDDAVRQANEDGFDLPRLITLLEGHNRILLRALAAVEIEARTATGKISQG